MKKKILILAGFVFFLFLELSAQNAYVIRNDSSYFKNWIYLLVCTDQLNTGLVKSISQFNFDSAYIQKSSVLKPLKSFGLPEEITCFEFVFDADQPYPKSYYLSSNLKTKQIYRLTGFYRNDFVYFLGFLKSKGIKLTQAYLRREVTTIERIDLICLTEAFRNRKKFQNVEASMKRDRERMRYDCLQYHYQPVFTH
jgi:hypothetical protein